ncbi:MAG: hypothetical protein RI935_178 [Candidatus Parcubacteria bacterium]|jgi:hypothetical protein
MNEDLFLKYKKTITLKKNIKEDLIQHIQQTTAIQITEKEIIIEGKEIRFFLSSIKRSQLIKKNIVEILKEKGYYLK